jgi:hypothetical protein
MIRLLGRTSLVALFLLASSALASAQDATLVSDLTSRLGTSIDLRTDRDLHDRLLAAGLIDKTTFNLKVTPAVVQQAMSVERFYNQVDVTRYHVGDRIMVEQPGSGGKFSPRAEIAAVNPDGTYKVTVWDKPESVTHPTVRGHVDALTGEPPSSAPMSKIKVHDKNGNVVEETSQAPWLIRDNAREITLTQDQVDKLNGIVSPKTPYSVNGWEVDPATDAVLKAHLDAANEAADEILPPSELALPEDPVARKAKLQEITELQQKFLNKVFKDNYIDHPGNLDASDHRMAETLAAHPELRGKIGAVIESQRGVCTDQAAAMVAILNSVGPRIGLTARAIGGATIGENAGHGFVAIRLANGQMGMYDVTWHFDYEKNSFDSIDFATYDQRPDSNRKIDWISQETTKVTKFIDRTTEAARDLFRGYTQAEGAALLAEQARLMADKKGTSLDAAATAVLAANTGKEKIAGDFTASDIVAKAKARADALRTPDSRGVIRALDPIKDRVNEADRGGLDR